jgi:phenylpropionate dioxygenase-like ring-hydroxylating dioxygenase large terminal subunit
MVRNYPAWARSLIDPASFEHEQTRLGQMWTLLGVVTDLTNDGDWFRTILGGRSIFVQRFGQDLRGFENVCAHRFYPLRTKDKGNVENGFLVPLKESNIVDDDGKKNFE